MNVLDIVRCHECSTVGSTEIYGCVTKISVRQKKNLGHITKISVRQFFFNVSSQQLDRAIPM